MVGEFVGEGDETKENDKAVEAASDEYNEVDTGDDGDDDDDDYGYHDPNYPSDETGTEESDEEKLEQYVEPTKKGKKEEQKVERPKQDRPKETLPEKKKGVSSNEEGENNCEDDEFEKKNDVKEVVGETE